MKSPIIMLIISIVLFAIGMVFIDDRKAKRVEMFFSFICAMIALLTFLIDYSGSNNGDPGPTDAVTPSPTVSSQPTEGENGAPETSAVESDMDVTDLSTPSTEADYPTLEKLQGYVDSGKVNTLSNEGVSLVLPTKYQMLDTPFLAKVVQAPKAIYVMPIPAKDNGHLGTVDTGSIVWIVAETENFYFFVSDMYTMGWNGKVFFRAQ